MNLALLSFTALLAAAQTVVAPPNLETAFQDLKDGVAKKDVGQVKKLAADACALAREAIAEPAPAGADEKQAWTNHVAFARDVELYSEYALYAIAVQVEPATTIDLLATLEQQNPKSKYLPDAYGRYFYALHQTGAAAKIPALAEKVVANFPDNDDALLVLAENTYSKKQADRALGYAHRLTAALNKRGKPEGMAAGDWERKRSAGLASGYWISGVLQAEKGIYFEADKDLRAALPLLGGNQARKSTALFYLGLANYQLGKMTMKKALVLEGMKFSQDAAAIQGPLAQEAWHNAQIMRDEAAKMR